MTPELLTLTLAALLWGVQFFLYLASGHGSVDLNAAMGPRDVPFDRPTICARMHRALSNHTEGLVLYAIAAGVITLTDQSTAVTATCAWIYLTARVLYVPSYAYGWTPGRTLIWMTGFFATMAMLVAALI